MVVNIPTDIESALTKQASRKGTTPQKIMLHLLRDKLTLPQLESEDDRNLSARQTTLIAIQNGKYTHSQPIDVPLYSDRFAAEKNRERLLEERRWAS